MPREPLGSRAWAVAPHHELTILTEGSKSVAGPADLRHALQAILYGQAVLGASPPLRCVKDSAQLKVKWHSIASESI